MSNISVLNQFKTMSSNEIAQLTGKRKNDIHQDIKTQLFIGLYGFKDGGNLNHEQIQGITVVLDNRNYWKEVHLDREHTLTLITGYDVKARHSINKRWLELEEKQLSFQLPNFNNPVEAARAWADEFEQKQLFKEERDAAIAQNEADRPKREFAMAVRNMEGLISVGDFAKIIGYGRNTFFEMMRGDKLLMQDNIPYQRYVDGGLFKVVAGAPYIDSQGKAHPVSLTMITGKGQVFLEKKYRQEARNGLVKMNRSAS